ncbi:unnamed protein product [Echinostoma caproni]|uniref:Aldedh domain-containing protein n=1 Tax=Echinostoma caproni TaxID=27848 RepID=A0A183B2J8_9TREM|nr:unnamed protein product [Echinostoma caproni]
MIRTCRSLSLSSRLHTVAWNHLVPKNEAYVAGKWTAAASGKTFPVFNPVDHTELCRVPAMSSAEVHLAIQSAKTAQSLWAKRSTEERASIIRDWARGIFENRDALAHLITAENVGLVVAVKKEMTEGQPGALKKRTMKDTAVLKKNAFRLYLGRSY